MTINPPPDPAAEDAIGKIFLVMQHELSEAWEKYDGAEFDDLDEYGDAYENAYYKAKQALLALIAKRDQEAYKRGYIVGGINQLNQDWLEEGEK